MKRKILFVCTGNTCRSPMAATIFKEIVEREPALRGRFVVDSAGIAATNGFPATYEAKVTIENRGLSLDNHLSKKLSRKLVDNADLILVMESYHKGSLLEKFNKARNKTRLLSEYVDEQGQVLDPYNKPITVYVKTAEQIEKYLIKLEKILRNSKDIP